MSVNQEEYLLSLTELSLIGVLSFAPTSSYSQFNVLVHNQFPQEMLELDHQALSDSTL